MWDMCQMLNIWHISHTKHKKQLPSDVAYVPKLYHLCSYRFKFATVWTDVVKRNNVLYLAFSLLSLPVLISSLSLFSHQTQLPSTEKEQNDTPIGSSPSSLPSEAQAAWVRPLQSDHRHRHRRRRRKWHGRGHSDHRHSNRIIAIAIVVRGASDMGEATLIIHIVITVVITAPISPISLSFLVVGCFDCWWLADFG